MRKLLMTFGLIAFSTSTAWASHNIDVKVNGMVCDFCAQSVWKVLEDYEAVKNVNIDLDTGIVSINLNEGQTLTEDELNKAIQYAGYDLVRIDRHEHE